MLALGLNVSVEHHRYDWVFAVMMVKVVRPECCDHVIEVSKYAFIGGLAYCNGNTKGLCYHTP